MATVTREMFHKMYVLNALDWSRGEIATEVGVAAGTVGDYMNRLEEQSKRDDVDPFVLFRHYYISGEFDRLLNGDLPSQYQPIE